MSERNDVGESRVAPPPIDIWRLCVVVSFGVSVLRGTPLGEVVPSVVFLASQFGALLVAMVTLTREPAGKARRVDWLLLLSLLWLAFLATVSSTWSERPSTTLVQGAIFGFVALFFALTYTRRWIVEPNLVGDLRTLYFAVAGAQVAGLGAVLLQQDWALGNYGRFQGLTGNPNYAGALSALALVLGVHVALTVASRLRWFVIGVQAVLLCTLLWSDSRGAAAAAGVGLLTALLMWVSRNARIVVAVGFAVLVSLGVALVSRSSALHGSVLRRQVGDSDFTSGRAEIWRATFRLWQDHPILGAGFRTTEELISSDGLTAHNIYLSFLAELSILGLVSLLLVFVLAIWGRPRTRPLSILVAPAIAVMVLELTEASIHGFGNSTALLSWTLVLACGAAGLVARSSDEPLHAAPLGSLAGRMGRLRRPHNT